MDQRVVLITGASRGFGEVAARELARRGHRVIASMRKPEVDGEKVRAGYEDLMTTVSLDVTDPAAVNAVVSSIVAEHGRIDAVVNNAGYGLYGAVEDLSEEELFQQFNTNFMGEWRVCKAVVPHMRAAGGGTIVNVSSLGARFVAPLTGMYSATKAAIEAMSEALRYEVDRFNIKVTMLEPGMYKSDWATTSLAVCDALSAGTSPYQESAEKALDAFRVMAETRPGPEAVGMVMADMVELQQNPPVRIPIGEDAFRLTMARTFASDDAWEKSMKTGPFFDGVVAPEAGPGFAGY
ncbi:SDR family oxidoreductase [Nocardioides marmoriginsengisoli]|uniref:SDR family oxidoreductase n=1 Tax=Nocardioides marmoriginsengisoli TaxID=661483 RepID=UPI00161C4C3A|nr:SDR family oxidoreductase [Nocardioides marmoriginsengisoli]